MQMGLTKIIKKVKHENTFVQGGNVNVDEIGFTVI